MKPLRAPIETAGYAVIGGAATAGFVGAVLAAIWFNPLFWPYALFLLVVAAHCWWLVATAGVTVTSEGELVSRFAPFPAVRVRCRDITSVTFQRTLAVTTPLAVWAWVPVVNTVDGQHHRLRALTGRLTDHRINEKLRALTSQIETHGGSGNIISPT